jgi:hypothetical protein
MGTLLLQLFAGSTLEPMRIAAVFAALSEHRLGGITNYYTSSVAGLALQQRSTSQHWPQHMLTDATYNAFFVGHLRLWYTRAAMHAAMRLVTIQHRRTIQDAVT